MKLFINYLCCKENFIGMILVNFFLCVSHAEVDDYTNKSLEARLHNIYEKHYSREVLDADWFKVIQSVQEQSYVVKKGDTLWGISSVYFGDGNYWSKLWSINKNITNPHLIFNGDQIQFTTGSFTQPPSISVTKANEGSKDTTATEVEDEAPTQDQSENSVQPLAEGDSKAGSDIPNDLPDFFKPPTTSLTRSENITSIEPRQIPTPATSIIVVQEVMPEAPKALCNIKSVGRNRVLASLSELIILTCKGNDPAIGKEFGVMDTNFQETDGGTIIKILGVVKVKRQIEPGEFEAIVTQQFDAIMVKSLITEHLPTKASIVDSGEKKEIPLRILNADKKVIWTSGDYVFLRTLGSSANVGDVLSFNNKYDYNINSFQRSANVKIVSTAMPYATGIVLNDSNELREDSVSAPISSDSWFF